MESAAGRAAANRIIANVSAIWRSYDRRYGLPVVNPTTRLQQAALKPRETRIPDAEFADGYCWVGAVGIDLNLRVGSRSPLDVKRRREQIAASTWGRNGTLEVALSKADAILRSNRTQQADLTILDSSRLPREDPHPIVIAIARQASGHGVRDRRLAVSLSEQAFRSEWAADDSRVVACARNHPS